MLVLVSRCTLRRTLQRPATIDFLAAIGTTIPKSTTIRTSPFRRRLFSTTPNNQKTQPKIKGRDMDQGVRVAIAGCGHGTLDALYASAQASCEARGWDNLDIFIIGGDFQAVRNAKDLSVMSVPAKYRELGDFPEYYSGKKKAPYLTVFVGGNHEASAHLWELYYGGWVAPNIYYMGAANVLRLGPLRIAGMGGIYNEPHYDKAHYERLPFSRSHMSSFYHTREFDVRKLLQMREQVDVVLSHDWPRAIENHGNTASLFEWKPHFKRESLDGSLGNPGAGYVMDRLRPGYWFSAHMHCKYPAVKKYQDPTKAELAQMEKAQEQQKAAAIALQQEAVANPDEIDLDMDDEAEPSPAEPADATVPSEPEVATPVDAVPKELREQLPASFDKPVQRPPGVNPGQPVPPTIKNKTVRFLALDKCLPGRKYLQLCDIHPISESPTDKSKSSNNSKQRYVLEYDPEWLAITRAFAPYLTIGGQHMSQAPPDLGEEVYRPMIDRERAWVDLNIVDKGKLAVPHNFALTATPHRRGVDPDFVDEQPDEHTNPQTTTFCELLGVPNLWDATPEERARRKEEGPKVTSAEPRFSRGGGFAGRGGGRGGGRGHDKSTQREKFVKGGRGWGKSVNDATEKIDWFSK
ncbi:lariat debranching enzyme, C-terminal domain-containing protein [Annulohypoxylon maeteangense]|uniref:lariat debranching enzyme, C-terminal domain-containing protein n=1 Tax=Annulohypoxylon maeteangense TaxID=1927788 RepID=UPI0020074798|nr:lariat debranching enzyme, C-terminal domain-containing protein [Annulohypoxylon maeteangense]KAI0884928.1 lariat debranching enzyme, C-terminal domain-containing protein [Annulohypoxylon maeteangense]